MPNSKKKGDRRERQARKILEKQDYFVETPNKTGYHQDIVDFFEVFDIIALKPGKKPLLIQVKSNVARGIQDFVEKVQEIAPFDYVKVEFWVCHDNEGWRILEVNRNGYQTVFDEREMSGNMGENVVKDYLDG